MFMTELAEANLETSFFLARLETSFTVVNGTFNVTRALINSLINLNEQESFIWFLFLVQLNMNELNE